MSDKRGLYVKYNVTKIEDGSTVDGCFVLRPEKDKHALAALAAYAQSVEPENPIFAEDLWAWIQEIKELTTGVMKGLSPPAGRRGDGN